MSSSRFQKLIALSVVLQLSSLPALAAELEYPELMMTPKYTERLEIESKDEGMRSWIMHLPIQMGALANIAGGVIMAVDPGNQTTIGGSAGISLSAYPVWAVPMAFGGIWLGLTLGLAGGYRPYTKALEAANAMPNKSKRDALLRERMAEEDFEFLKSLGWRLTALSVTTQTLSGAALMIINKPMSPAFFAGLGATLLAFAPLVFQYRWGSVANEQRDYKKRIYAPLASAGFAPELSRDGSLSLAPTLNLSFAF